MLVTNKKINNDIKLDLRVLECDMVESWYTVFKPDEIDGIRFDESWNPVAYRILKNHPGDYRDIKLTAAGDWVPAQYIIHYFTEERPGQVRGVSEILSALSLYGQLRKYTAAVIEAAARAAEISSVMQTTLVPDQVAADLADPITIIEAQRNAIVSLPEGWQLAQLKAEQPTTTYKMFKDEIIKEMARCINMPANVAQGDSSGYNYASGRLDHQSYDRAIDVERTDLVTMVIDRIYSEWLKEYALRKSLSAADLVLAQSHEWHFSGRGHVDPTKEAGADETRFNNGSLTKSAYYAKQGKDWKRESQQWIRERILDEVAWNEAREEAGLPPMPYPLNKVTDQSGREKQIEPEDTNSEAE
jgi:capsid protein